VLKCGPTGCVSCNILFQRKITLNYMWQEHLSLLCSTEQTPNYKPEIFVATRRKIVCDIVRFRNGTCLSPYSTISSHCLHWFHSSDQEILRFLRISGFDTGRQFCKGVFIADQPHYLVSCLMESDSRYKHKKNVVWKFMMIFLHCYKNS